MAEKELRELQAKAMLALKAMFGAALNPVTVQQVHPAQMAMASAMHTACWQALQQLDSDRGPETFETIERVSAWLHRIRVALGEGKLTKGQLFAVGSELSELSTIAMSEALEEEAKEGGPSA